MKKLGSSGNSSCEQGGGKEPGQGKKDVATACYHFTGLQQGKERMEVRVGLSMNRTLEKKTKPGKRQKQRSLDSKK